VSWFILHSRPGCERKVAGLLEVEGMNVFFPLIRVWSRPAHKRRPVLVDRIAFPTYGFLQEPGTLSERIFGYARLLTIEGRFALIHDDDISEMRAAGYVVDEGKAPPRFRAHQEVHLTHKLFGKIDGVIISICGSYAMLELSGNKMRLRVPIANLDDCEVKKKA
jgi:hypothetical protein